MAKIYVNDVGTVIELDTKVDLTGASAVEIETKKPDGTIVTWTGSIAGTGNTKIQYTTVAGDFDQVGLYELQAKVTSLSGFTGRGETVPLEVRNVFD